MPILDASILRDKPDDGDALRGILGPVAHGPRHVEEMRAAEQHAKTMLTRHDVDLSRALAHAKTSEAMIINRFHPSA